MFSANTSQVAAGGGATYIEDVFSTWLTTGASANITVVNGIDLSGKGGMVWQKTRTSAGGNTLFDTVRGVNKYLFSNATNAEASASNILPTFNNNGFVIGTDNNLTTSGENGVSWTFRKQPKFFDVVTYYGNGTSNTQIAHNLGSVPGCIIVKNLDSGIYTWAVYHRSLGATDSMTLNSTEATATTSNTWYDTDPTSTVFTLGNSTRVNQSGKQFVAYLFAHNAGGFGLTGTDNVISCGSVAVTGSAQSVSLGYEPQWILWKKSSGTDNWWMFDTMRGLVVDNGSGTGDKYLYANSSDAEAGTYGIDPTATGFNLAAGWGAGDYIYIAIRRGPMKVPTVGTSVFDISTVSTASGPVPGPTPTDMTLNKPSYNVGTNNWRANDRLRGGGLSLFPNTTDAESAENYVYFDYQSGLRLSSWPVATAIWYNFKRAPSFFDEVCYTGTGTNQFLNHNLGVRPDLYIVKRRSATANWAVTVNDVVGDSVGLLNSSNAFGGAAYNNGYLVNGTVPASNFGAGFGSVNNDAANASGSTYVAYLFATCAGVSKVGSYTGNGTTQTIDCGFGAGGARFVLIKRTDSTGDWYVYDTTRGMTTVTDPYLLVNSAAAQVATLGSVTTVSTGFALNASILAAINTNGASYIFLAIA